MPSPGAHDRWSVSERRSPPGQGGRPSVLRKTERSYSTSEVADYCSVTPDSVLKWMHSGKLSAFKTPGGRYRVTAEHLRDFLRRHGIPVVESFFSPDETDDQ